MNPRAGQAPEHQLSGKRTAQLTQPDNAITPSTAKIPAELRCTRRSGTRWMMASPSHTSGGVGEHHTQRGARHHGKPRVVLRRQHHSSDLGFVAHLGQGHDTGRDEECFHGGNAGVSRNTELVRGEHLTWGPLCTGFAFLELGTVRKKNQVNALVKILVDFSVSTRVYFVVGYSVAYGNTFFVGAEQLAAKNGYDLVKFFFLLTFAAANPAIISGGIAERAKFRPQLIATAVIVGFVYPLFEGIVWNQHFGVQAWIKALTGDEFHDFAGSVVVHAMGGWIALPAVILLVRDTTVTVKTVKFRHIPLRAFHFWPWARGSRSWAGLAST